MKRSRSLSGRSVPRAREPKMKTPVAPFSRRAASYVFKTLIRVARFMDLNIATIGAARRDSRWPLRGKNGAEHGSEAACPLAAFRQMGFFRRPVKPAA